MTRETALEEAIKLYGSVGDWRIRTPWLEAVARRWAELQNYGLGNTDRAPDAGWTLEGIAGLEGAPGEK